MKPSNIKEWLWSAKVLTTMVWILFPLGYITIIVILDLPSSYYRLTGLATFLDKLLGPSIFFIPPEVAMALGIQVVVSIGSSQALGSHYMYMPPIPYIAVLFLFSVLPAIYPTERFFKKRGNANAVIEYHYIRKILFVFLIAEIIIIITLYSLIPYANERVQHLSEQIGHAYERVGYLSELLHENMKIEFELLHEIPFLDESRFKSILSLRNQLLQEIDYQNNRIQTLEDTIYTLQYFVHSLYTIVFLLPTVPVFILLKLLLEHARKQFRFYYAKACFNIINETKDETDNAGYLLLGLEWYNKFVKRATKLYAIDVETIYSKVISHSQLSNNQLLIYIKDLFHEEDEFKPLRHMLTLLSGWKEGDILFKESLRTKIKESSDLLIPIVTVIITIVTTFFLKAPTPAGTN